MSSMAATAPLLELAAAALKHDALQLLTLHRATAKLGFIVTALLAGVVQEGFCTPPEAADGALSRLACFQQNPIQSHKFF